MSEVNFSNHFSSFLGIGTWVDGMNQGNAQKIATVNGDFIRVDDRFTVEKGWLELSLLSKNLSEQVLYSTKRAEDFFFRFSYPMYESLK